MGSIIQQFRGRFHGYRSGLRTYSNRKAAGILHIGSPVPQVSLFKHFPQEVHHGMDYWSFQIIDSSWSLQKLGECEAFLQYRLNTFLSKCMDLPSDLVN